MRIFLLTSSLLSFLSWANAVKFSSKPLNSRTSGIKLAIVDFTFGLGAGPELHLEHILGCSCQLRQGSCKVATVLVWSCRLSVHHKLCVEIEVLLCLPSFWSALKLFVPLQLSNRGSSVAAYYNLEILLVVQVRFLLLKFRNSQLDLGFTAVAVTREFPVSHCSYVGFFGLDLYMQVSGFLWTHFRKDHLFIKTCFKQIELWHVRHGHCGFPCCFFVNTDLFSLKVKYYCFCV